MLPILQKKLLDRWAELPISRSKPQKISFLSLRSSVFSGLSKFKLFADKDESPLFLLKILRLSSRKNQLLLEASLLKELSSSLPQNLKKSIPQLILCEEFDDTLVLLETSLEGIPMKETANSSNSLRHNFDRALDWLLKFNIETVTNVNSSIKFQQHVQNLVEKFIEIFYLNNKERKYLEHISSSIQRLEGYEGKNFSTHGYFAKENILISSNDHHIKVADWEFCKKTLVPFVDMFSFLCTYPLTLCEQGLKQEYLSQFENCYFKNTDYGELNKRWIRKFAESLQIDRQQIELFFVLFLIETSINEYNYLIEAAGLGFLPLLKESRNDKRSYLFSIKDQLWINIFKLVANNKKNFVLFNNN